MRQRVDFDIAVIGGGIVGLASAYKIGLYHPDVRIVVLEKEEQLAFHQTGHNSNIIRSCVYYNPCSNKAKTFAAGRKELIAFAKEHGIHCDIVGEIIVATKEKELISLEQIFQNGLENQIEGIEKIGHKEIKAIEPFCRGMAGIYVPSTGIIDFAEVARKLGRLIEAKSAENKVLTSHEVIKFDRHDFFTRILTEQGNLTVRYVINCAGLQCDKIAKMYGVETKIRIVPFRMDYYELTEQAKEKVSSLISPVPDPVFPFFGFHFTRTTDGLVECGPNIVFSFGKEGYQKNTFCLEDCWNTLFYGRTWKFLIRNLKYEFGEYSRLFSKDFFLKRVQRLIPTLVEDDIKFGRSGVLARAVASDGRVIDDFRIERQGNSIHILNIPSPSATMSLAIGDYISQQATEYFNFEN